MFAYTHAWIPTHELYGQLIHLIDAFDRKVSSHIIWRVIYEKRLAFGTEPWCFSPSL